MWWLLLGCAWAAEPLDFPNIEAPLSVGFFRKVDEGPPARGVGRRLRSGAFKTWLLPNGNIEHYERRHDGELVELRRFDSHHAPHTTVRYRNGQPAFAVVHGVEDHTFDVQSWLEITQEAMRLRVPSATAAPDRVLSESDAGTFQAWWSDETPDVTDEVFQRGLEAGSGGLVVTHATAWVGGKAGARYLLELPHPTHPAIAETWAVPVGDKTWVAMFTARAGATPSSLDPIAMGRAIIALVEWTDTP